MDNEEFGYVHFRDANSRETYFSIHNIRPAHRVSTGKNIKIGILDHLFSIRKHPDVFSGGVDFADNPESLNRFEGHGYWMACTLKEIAPHCQIYALNVCNESEEKQVAFVVNAIEWSIENNIDILTYSHARISDRYRQDFDAAVNKAVSSKIVTTFIHYDNENNIWPTGMCPFIERGFCREPDVNIYHYDYNVLFLDQYRTFKCRSEPPRSGNDIPFFSISSTSPVTAGFVAILKEIRRELSPLDYKEVLIKTSYKRSYEGIATFEHGECPRVVNIDQAVRYMQNVY
jgi:hypothetical protein